MTQNLFETQYDVTKKSRLKKFYEKNKILIFSSITILIIFLGSYSFYLENKENKKIALSEKYIQAKVYLEQENKDEALKTLKELIFADDPTYSTLSFFLLMNQNLVSDNKEMSVLFNRVISNNQFSREMKNLLVYKKALFSSNFVEESELLESIRPLLNDETVWKPHALILLGDYFASKGEFLKAIEFYQKVYLIKNLREDLYSHVRSQLAIISNE
tara:strand:- start:342 stop:989 length:648 start_codon:yes stop_codon:yes gene_type:complete